MFAVLAFTRQKFNSIFRKILFYSRVFYIYYCIVGRLPFKKHI